MATAGKEKGEISLPINKLGGKISFSGGLDKEAIMKRFSMQKKPDGLIVRKGSDEEEQVPENTSGLSRLEQQRRMTALDKSKRTSTVKAPERRKEKVVAIEDMAIEEITDSQNIEHSHFKPTSFGINQIVSGGAIKLEEDIILPAKDAKKKTQPESPIITFKQGDGNLSVLEDIIKSETETKVDKRDKTLIEKMMKHYKYLEFDSDAEIEDLQKGIELRNTLEDKRKNTESASEDVQISSAGEADEEIIKVRREAFFSRHNRKPTKKRTTSHNAVVKEVDIYDKNLVIDIAKNLGVKVEILIKKLKSFGLSLKENDIVDGDTAELAVEEMGYLFRRVKKLTAEDKLIKQGSDANLRPVVPVVTIMGHVDHGKTSLLDALRRTNVAGKEAGGITQHIGAYQTTLSNGKKITFIDTPGHEAFTAIRARGASVTHVVILVVAADDGIMPQTIEAINHAKAAGVPIVVAINKIDKPGVDIQKIKNELLSHSLVSEDLGGDTIFVPISAKLSTNLDKLCEAVLLQAEVFDAKADCSALASGVVLEGKLDKQKGVVSTLLVQNGTLKTGDVIIIDDSYFKARLIVNDMGESIKFAEPSMPVEVYGLANVPIPGSSFNVVENEKLAKEITTHRRDKKVEAAGKQTTGFSKASFDEFLKNKQEQKKAINIIIRADVQSTIEAIKHSIASIKVPSEIEIKIMQSMVGNVTEADILLAKTNGAMIFSFASKLASKEEEIARRNNVVIKEHSIIYKLTEDINAMINDKLAPVIKDEIIGDAEVRTVFDITKAGKIAGCMVKKGVVRRNTIVKILRNGVFISEGKLKTLKHFKEDVKELAQGNECGIQVEGFEDFKAGDTLQIVERTEERTVFS